MKARTLSSLQAIFGADKVIREKAYRKTVSRDLSPMNLTDGAGETSFASVAVYPHGPDHERQLRELVALARSASPHLRLVPRGGGTGVCGAQNAYAGDIVVDCSMLSDMRLENVNGKLLLHLQAGTTGEDIERELMSLPGRVTHGHYPASYLGSTFGGWVAAGGSGQYASRFGTIRDLLGGVRGVDGRGRSFAYDAAIQHRSVIGMEGTTGFVTGGTMELVDMPPEVSFLAFRMPDIERTTALMHELHQLRDTLHTRGSELYAVRCYDWFDTNFVAKPHKAESGKTPDPAALTYRAERWLCDHSRSVYGLVRALEGGGRAPWTGILMLRSWSPTATDRGIRVVTDAVRGNRGRMTDPAIARTWYANRFKLGYEKLLVRKEAGILADTFDCVPAWQDVPDTYRHVRSALSHHGVVGAHLCMDLTGPYLYFTFALPGTEYMRHRDAWQAALDACIGTGARTNHHHGIGRLKAGNDGKLAPFANGRDWYEDAQRVKSLYDPDRVLNPDNLV